MVIFTHQPRRRLFPFNWVFEGRRTAENVSYQISFFAFLFKCQFYSLVQIAYRTNITDNVTDNVFVFILALKTREKDGTSSSLKHSRQSTKKVSVNESNIVFCKGIFNKTYFRVDRKLSEVRNKVK